MVESTQDLASGQWEAITTVEGSGRHEVIEMLITEQAQVYLRVRSQWRDPIKEFISDREFNKARWSDSTGLCYAWCW